MSASPERPDDPASVAERLYAEAILDLPPGQPFDLEALCAAHPEHAPDLRRTHGLWQQLSGELRGLRPGSTLEERLRSRQAAGREPGAPPQDRTESGGDTTDEVMARLAGRQAVGSRYTIEEQVERGGMGAILRVWDEDLRRHLAMKVVLGRGQELDSEEAPQIPAGTLARFLEEAQITGQLDHPGIVPVHELGIDSRGRAFFTMKLVRGRTLKTVFEELERGEGGWTRTRVLGLILRVCEAMAYAHDKQVIHRDLKPANVMVGKFGEVYVMDWGLAKILGREDTKDLRLKPQQDPETSALLSGRSDLADEDLDSPLYTMDGDVVGTPAYMSPEQAGGQVAEMSPASDVYAIGAMIYHLFAGHMPYVPSSQRASNYAVWRWVREGPPQPLHEAAPQAPAELIAICEKAMSRDPHARYANTSELAEDLSAYIEGRVVHAYETGAWAEARKWIKRNRPLAAALGAAAVLAVAGLGGIGYVETQGRQLAEEQRGVAQLERERADIKTREAEQNLALARRNEADAQAQRETAERERARAEAVTAKVLRLSDVKVLQQLEAQADALWPAHPATIPALEEWLGRARALAANLPVHRATLEAMRAGAREWSPQERARDRAAHPRAGELPAQRAELEDWIARLEAGLDEGERAAAELRVAELESALAELEAQLDSRRSWSFDTPEEDWQHGVLVELIGDLETFEAGLLHEAAVTPAHGWSVTRRLAFARELEAGLRPGGEHARAWSEALPAIAAAYPGLDLRPQMGFLPLGPDPDSGLWEFAHLMTGEPAQRDRQGRLILTEATGAVLVLLPGGSFWMGAQQDDPSGRNYDPQAPGGAAPVHEVELTPFLLCKYELTQGQWQRVVGRNPSNYQHDDLAPTLLHPVEQVSWLDCRVWLQRTGLDLPSEAQWEYGARAGTGSVWWTGDERDSLRARDAANLADRAAARADATWETIDDWPELDDGFAAHAPAGTYAANAFGLHEVAGNLWEWCLDGYDGGYYEISPRRDPLAPWEGAAARVIRGGAFDRTAEDARSACRGYHTPTGSGFALGVRPARALE